MSQLKYKSIAPQCPLCHIDFDIYYRTPRVIPKCGHTFCQKCIQNKLQIKSNRKVFQCTECNTEVIIRKGVSEDIPKNVGIMDIVKNIRKLANYQQVEELPKRYQNVCQIHKKSLDLVCQTCNYLPICTQCLILGSHKSHSFCKQAPASSLDIKQLKQIFQIISQSMHSSIMPSPTNIKQNMRQKMIKTLQQNIKEHFKQYFQIIQKKEAEILVECQQISLADTSLDKNLDSLLRQYEQLKLKYQNFNQKTSLNSIQQFINRCKELHQNIQQIETHATKNTQKFIQDLSVKISHSLIFKIQEVPFTLKRLITPNDINSPERRQRMKSAHSDVHSVHEPTQRVENKFTLSKNKNHSTLRPDQTLIDFSSLNYPPVKQPILKQNITKHSSIDKSTLQDKTDPQIDKKNQNFNNINKTQVFKNLNIPKQKQKVPSQFQARTLNLKELKSETQLQQRKTLKKQVSPAKSINLVQRNPKAQTQRPVSVLEQLKFIRPQKEIAFQYQSKLHDIINQIDRQVKMNSNCLQLVSADITDMLLHYLLNYLKSRKYKFQMMKLVKNFITDEGFRVLLSYLISDDSTQVLNLTSNQLNGKSLDTILQFTLQNHTLKTIYLSHNKITSSNLKAKKDELQLHEIEIIL